MSTIIMSACWPLQGMSPTQKAVLISLADNASDEGVCWPSINTIGVRTCLSERAVRGALRWLEDAGVLTSNQRYGRSTWYTITPAGYAPGTKCPPAADAPPPRQEVPDTPAAAAPRTVIEPSSEPSPVVEGANSSKVSKLKCEPQAIVDLFNQTLPGLPQVAMLTKDRKAKIKARWDESDVHQDLEFWADFFALVGASTFLMGAESGRDGAKPFRATFDWLIKPSNFVKVVEGNYNA
ncbi:helix-turn-helix domain-containing protein [Pseudomonas helleri]|uniref:helix-turn-helix domain-containing protein n=1 Tax=Pseudomonas helleri TaxID=1608996 RepID=UPI0030D6CFEA